MLTEIALPTECFYVATMQDLYFNGPLRDHLDCINYIQKYYFESSNGKYYFYDVLEDEFVFKTKDDFKSEILDKLDNCKIVTRALKMNNKIYKLVNNLYKPRQYIINNKDYFLNSCQGFLHRNYKQFDEYSQEIKDNVKLFLDFQKEIMANNDQLMFEAYIKYYAQIARGMKTEIIIYRKGEQGIGKSTECDFMFNHVFGLGICYTSNTEPLTTHNNKPYMGKLLINFEELPTFSEGQWSAISSKLKTLTTEKRCVYRDLYEKSITAENISNFQINTNVEAIRDSNGRRYIILDINHSKMGDFEYFKTIKTRCFNNQVGEAYYSYLMTKISDEDANNFYGQRDFPETSNKLLSISKLLSSSSRFIKENYVLQQRGIDKIKCKDFLELYEEFCNMNNIKAYGRNDFYKKLEILNIKPKNGTNHSTYFEESLENLNKISKLHKWICEYDEFTTEESNENKKSKPIPMVNLDLVEDNNELKKENQELRNKVDELSKKIDANSSKKNDANLRNTIKKMEDTTKMLTELVNNYKLQFENSKKEYDEFASNIVIKKEMKEQKKIKDKKKVIETFVDSIELF